MMKHAYYFYNAIGGDYKLSYDELPTFLKHAQIWDSFIKWHKEGRLEFFLLNVEKKRFLDKS